MLETNSGTILNIQSVNLFKKCQKSFGKKVAIDPSSQCDQKSEYKVFRKYFALSQKSYEIYTTSVGGHSFSAYQGVNVSFSKIFAYVLHEWSLKDIRYCYF